jgi:hypothetical protein
LTEKNSIPARLLLSNVFLNTSICLDGATPMDENVQQKIALACIAFLQKNAADEQQERKRNSRYPIKTKKDAIELLLSAASELDIVFENITDALWIIFQRSKPGSQTRQWVTQLLFELAQREDIIIRDAVEVATALYLLSPPGSPEQQEGVQRLLALAKRRDIPFYDTVEAAHSLYLQSSQGSKERQQAIEMLLEQAHWPDTTAAQALEAALALCYASPYRSPERKQAVQALIELTRRPDLIFEDAVILDDQRITVQSTRALEQQQRAAKQQMWETIAQRSDLTTEQRAQVALALEDYRWLVKDHKLHIDIPEQNKS